MHTLHPTTYRLAIALSMLAGYVDAVGFLHLGGYFISFMSGNTTRFAISLSGQADGNAAILALILGLFVVGTTLGTVARRGQRFSAFTRVLMCVTVLLTAAALSNEAGYTRATLAFMVLAMGAENAIFQRNGDVIIGLTYMTGTLVKIGQHLATALLGGPKSLWVPYAFLWLGLLSGGVLGAVVFSSLGAQSLWLAVPWAGMLAVLTEWKRHRFTLHPITPLAQRQQRRVEDGQR